MFSGFQWNIKVKILHRKDSKLLWNLRALQRSWLRADPRWLQYRNRGEHTTSEACFWEIIHNMMSPLAEAIQGRIVLGCYLLLIWTFYKMLHHFLPSPLSCIYQGCKQHKLKLQAVEFPSFYFHFSQYPILYKIRTSLFFISYVYYY